MADVSIPGAVYNQNPTDIPLESQPVSTLTGLGAQFGAAMRSTLGVSLETQAIGLIKGGDMIPYDQIKGVFEDQKLDPSVFPKGQPVRRGEALAVFGQQLAIQKDRDLAERAHLGGFSGGAAGFVGGLADPAIIGGGLIAGPLLGAARAGLDVGRAVETGAPLVTRALTGAAEGGAFVGTYEKAQQQLGTAQGDRDITTGQIVHDAMWGSILGGVIKGAVGARPAKVDLEPHLQMIARAENTTGYAKAHGLNPDQVVSSKGAVGIYQITPDTAKSLGFSGDPEMLKDPAYNKQVAQANMEKLYKRYGNDPEAIAVAWNAGPGVADKFIKAGRNYSVLPKETRSYLVRIDTDGKVPAFGKKVNTPFVEPADDERMSPQVGGVGTMVPSREMPNGELFPGKPGGTHLSTLTEEQKTEIEENGGFTSAGGGPGIEPTLAKYGRMGYQQIQEDGSLGKFLSREEAEALVGGPKRPGGLETVNYNSRGIPDAVDVATLKTAVAQAEMGSEINVEPVIKAMNDESSKEPFKANPNELAAAIPQRNSEKIAPVKDILLAMNKQVSEAKPEPTVGTTGRDPHPAIAEIQRLAKEATEEASNIHAGLTGETVGAEGNKFETYMKASEEEFLKSEGAEGKPEFQKALEAAVQCGLKNGVE